MQSLTKFHNTHPNFIVSSLNRWRARQSCHQPRLLNVIYRLGVSHTSICKSSKQLSILGVSKIARKTSTNGYSQTQTDVYKAIYNV